MPNSYQPNDNTREISKKKITKTAMNLPEKVSSTVVLIIIIKFYQRNLVYGCVL